MMLVVMLIVPVHDVRAVLVLIMPSLHVFAVFLPVMCVLCLAVRVLLVVLCLLTRLLGTPDVAIPCVRHHLVRHQRRCPLCDDIGEIVD